MLVVVALATLGCGARHCAIRGAENQRFDDRIDCSGARVEATEKVCGETFRVYVVHGCRNSAGEELTESVAVDTESSSCFARSLAGLCYE